MVVAIRMTAELTMMLVLEADLLPTRNYFESYMALELYASPSRAEGRWMPTAEARWGKKKATDQKCLDQHSFPRDTGSR